MRVMFLWIIGLLISCGFSSNAPGEDATQTELTHEEQTAIAFVQQFMGTLKSGEINPREFARLWNYAALARAVFGESFDECTSIERDRITSILGGMLCDQMSHPRYARFLGNSKLIDYKAKSTERGVAVRLSVVHPDSGLRRYTFLVQDDGSRLHITNAWFGGQMAFQTMRQQFRKAHVSPVDFIEGVAIKNDFVLHIMDRGLLKPEAS